MLNAQEPSFGAILNFNYNAIAGTIVASPHSMACPIVVCVVEGLVCQHALRYSGYVATDDDEDDTGY